MGSDLVAVDATSARVMGLRPERLDYLRTAAEFLGNLPPGAVLQRGESVARFATSFQLLPQFAGLRA
jgi:hypothetical protein